MECERLLLEPLSLAELEQIQREDQKLLDVSVLSEVIKIAVLHKIEQMRAAPAGTHPWLTYWRIREKESGRGIGVIGSKNLPDAEGYVELGYAVARDCRNRGYMTEALEGFLDWLYGHPFCSGAVLYIRGNNLPSVKVAEACGFQYEGMQDIYRRYRYIF